MTSTGLSSGAAAAADALNRRQPANGGSKADNAACDFEALLLGQILKSAHEGGGWLGGAEDDASDAAVGLGEEQLARTMASSGGLGLAKVIESGFRNEHPGN